MADAQVRRAEPCASSFRKDQALSRGRNLLARDCRQQQSTESNWVPGAEVKFMSNMLLLFFVWLFCVAFPKPSPHCFRATWAGAQMPPQRRTLIAV